MHWEIDLLEMECGKIAKPLVFFFNFIFWLSGLALIIIGAILKAKYGNFMSLADSKFSDAAVFIIIIGSIVTVIGFVGCCGAWKENHCLLTTFVILLSVIFILEIVAGALGFAYREKVAKAADNLLERGVKNYGKNKTESEEGTKEFMDWAQKSFKCCGKSGASDYKVPPKSCGDAKVGCSEGLKTWLKHKLYIIGALCIGIAFIQILGIILGLVLRRYVNERYEVM